MLLALVELCGGPFLLGIAPYLIAFLLQKFAFLRRLWAVIISALIVVLYIVVFLGFRDDGEVFLEACVNFSTFRCHDNLFA
jgi:hypothetical protein